MFFILDSENRRDAVIQYIQKMPLNGKIGVHVTDYIRNRTQGQNRMWHGWTAVIARSRGEDVEMVRTEFKKAVLGHKKVHDANGQVFYEVRGTSDLTVQEMTNLLRAVEFFATQEGIHLPRHDDYSFAMMYEEEKKKGKVK